MSSNSAIFENKSQNVTIVVIIQSILMLYLMFLIAFTRVACISDGNVGSILFHNRLSRKLDCWTEEDVAKLRARKMFQQIIPAQIPLERMNTKYVKGVLRYFRTALNTVEQNANHCNGVILKEALADTIGGFVYCEILPKARFAYYAGYIPYRNVRHINDFLDELKLYLNTQGVGWRRPERVPQWSNLTVVKVLIGPGKLILDPCSSLVIRRDSKSCINLPSPKLDDAKIPSAIALPFKSGGFVSLSSPKSEDILLKFYTTASRCILRSSPEACRHSSFVNFNNELWHWMKRDVAPHLGDEKLYAAYGGVLRIAAAVQNYGKGLSRRNLYDNDEDGSMKWHPWKALTQTYLYVNTDWSSKFYIAFVLLAAFAIYLFQICYNHVFGDGNACHCKGRSSNTPRSKDVTYANVETNFPAMLPQTDVYYSETKRETSPSKVKTSSHGSMTTQRVYDMNANKEKLMEVIVSDNEISENESITSKEDSDKSVDNHVIDVCQTNKKSPPRIETPISQLRIERALRIDEVNRSRLPMYSTSSMTRSEDKRRPVQQASDSVWSVTGSSTSVQSVSSDSTKSRCRRSASSRDIAWARRVISKHSLHHKSNSGTEFTTPPSQR